MTKSISAIIAEELSVHEKQVSAAITLLGEGATVPFISRYRKEVTGGLDDTQMRCVEERLRYLRELDDRRQSILKNIQEQGKLTPELQQSIAEAQTKIRLEDLYLPYKTKRRTKAQIAIEAGLEPLADQLLEDPRLEPKKLSETYLNPELGINDSKAALDGAKQILMERFASDADLLTRLRDFIWNQGSITSKLVEGGEAEGAKFRDYFDHVELVQSVPSHRALAMLRGRNEGFLSLNLVASKDEKPGEAHPGEAMIAKHWNIQHHKRPADDFLAETVRWTWRVKLLTHIQTDLLGRMRDQAEQEAIRVFASNLKDLLLVAPAGSRPTIGLDPGFRTGVKVAVVDSNGKVLDHGAIFPHQSQRLVAEAQNTLLKMIRQYDIELIAIGNGTASRETDKFVGELLAQESDIRVQKVMVNEAGASIYSASELAAQEFPDLDVTIRGAVSIARRLQDPLAELVKIDPKSIGVGQYQHDLSQTKLARELDTVVEDCVNAVGVDVNTASVPLLKRVSGLNQTIAANIVSHRDTVGAFADRRALKKVARFGDKTFEQAAGFLRIMGGDNPLDASAVHPESYVLVEHIAKASEKKLISLIGDSKFLRGINPQQYVTDLVGLPTITDIFQELEKPGRDPRPEFKVAELKAGVEKIADLKPNMVLEGTVTNVTNFGAFVDVGVHQDGLVHISVLADRFVKDPRDVVKTGEIVKVKVMEVDSARNRIALSMRMGDSAESTGTVKKKGTSKPEAAPKKKQHRESGKESPSGGAFAQAFAQAKKRR